jgi:digeranylgeranylglycerophospholipid reductase
MGVERPQVLTTMDCDVVVVGGGPAGLIAARDLAAGGFSTTILEEHDTIGAPVHCTGVLGLDAIDELDLPRHTILDVASSARFVSADGTALVIETDRIRAAIVDRVRFDRALAETASQAGATIVSGQRVRTIDSNPDDITVRTPATTVRARACVLACGASYRFNRALGLGLPRVMVHSAQLEVPFVPVDHMEVHVGRRVAPGGFAWVVPFRRDGEPRARIGLMCESRARARFRSFAERLRCTHGIAAPWAEPRLKVLPLGPVPRTSAARVVAVGDAAGLVKPTTGGGIYYGLLSGRLAAGVLAAALREGRLDARRLREYDDRWRQRLGPEIRAGLAFRHVVSRLSDRALDALIELARVDGIVPLLKQTADFNWHRAAALSLLRNASFRRIVFTSLWN